MDVSQPITFLLVYHPLRGNFHTFHDFPNQKKKNQQWFVMLERSGNNQTVLIFVLFLSLCVELFKKNSIRASILKNSRFNVVFILKLFIFLMVDLSHCPPPFPYIGR